MLGCRKLAPLPLALVAGSLVMIAVPKAASPGDGVKHVPFVACKSDGQAGPVAGPKRREQTPAVPAPVASGLAYYASRDLGVLAPRGWHCFGLYGSSGATLIVTPEPHGAKDLLDSRKKLTGPAIVLRVADGETSGRFEVARVEARLFPGMKEEVQQFVAREADAGVAERDYPFGPYSDDILTPRGDREVEFETPANKDGTGTESWLEKNSMPIKGLAVISDEEGIAHSLALLTVRIPPERSELVSVIMRETVRQTEQAESR